MDQLDYAKEFEQMRRRIAVESVLNAPDKEPDEEQRIVNGVVTCIDCRLPISTHRLTIKPDAVRCVYCKAEWEARK